jgi:hypothetical protein
VVGSLIGGGPMGKLFAKYFWRADKAIALGKRIVGLGNKLWDDFKDWKKSKKAAEAAEKTVKECNSFTPGTRVLMADGSTKKIEDVDIGDKVLAADPETGKTKAETVTAEIKGTGLKRLVKVTIDTDGEKGSKTASVTATDGHPFWVPELGQWLRATDLTQGEWLSTSAGTRVQITAVTRWTVPLATVHNLTVAELHTYYVLAGATSALVHNCGGAEDATEIVSKKAGDGHFGSQDEARSAALRAHGVSDESLVETRTIYGKNSGNLRGPDGEPWEELDAINDNGEMVTIGHHANGHYFEDNNTYALPHYHGPGGEHFFYGQRIW